MSAYAPYARRSDAVVGYDFQAETLCPTCAVVKVAGEELADLGSAEMVLNFVAERIGLDREDEHSFDSGDFPKVIFDVQVEGDETCMECGEVL